MQQKIRITKRIGLEIAHVLHNYDGNCAAIHGHSYELSVTLRGIPLMKNGHPKDGMLMDFHDFKELLNKVIKERFCHHLIVSESYVGNKDIRLPSKALLVVDYQPTCENILFDMVTRIKGALDNHIELFKVILQETDTCSCEWCAEDYI